MSTRVVDQVDSWSDRSFGGGYRELQALADEEFSGVVRAGGAELYMTRGVVVGIQRGDIEDFETSGTVYQSPTDALPLLAVMQQRSDEVRAKYYTEDTSISKVDNTLSDGGFTGYIELSENVLSGDYYLVYHAGTSMSVAYVGESTRLLDGDEAFETADDEVGIYEVRPVEVDPIDIPEPGPEDDEPGEEDSPEPASDTDEQTAEPAPGDSAQAATATGEARPASAEPADQPPSEDTEPADRSPAQPTESTDRSTTESAKPTEQTGPAASSEPTAEQSDQTQRPRETRADAATRQESTTANTADQRPPTSDRPTGNGASRPESSPSRSPRESGRAQSGGGATRRETETKSIPSLDPDQTAVPEAVDLGDATQPSAETTPAADPEPTPQPEPEPASAPDPNPEPTSRGTHARDEPTPREQTSPGPAPSDRAGGGDPARVEELESKLDERDEEIDRLEAELSSVTDEREDLEAELASVTDERDDLEAELARLRQERDDLQEEAEQLRSDLDRLEEELGAATDADRRLSAEQALSGTDIFVRYRSKGKATLEKAHGGSTRKENVNENLRLEKHTQFDAETVAVGGQSYHEFLESTLEYQFVRWVVRELLFEIRDTGHQKALADLYDVLPRIDRAELSGVIEVTYTEDGQETQSQEGFDVVLRDRMGNPLLAANLNDSREATTESMMERLITSAERVGQSSGGFSGAFLVTESFFDPGALEVASDATQGGLLSRDKRKSFVNLSRKRGYHLCLVEARNENFHLAVPEL